MSKKGHYFKIPNYHIWDRSLSAGAKGLMTTLLMLPKTWDFSLNGLAALSNDSVSKTRKLIKELECAGYLKRYPIHENGRISRWAYEFDGTNQYVQNQWVENQHVENEHIEIQHVENQCVENCTQLNKELSNIKKELNIKEIKERKKGNDDGVNFDSIIDTFEDEKIKEALRKFIKMRFANKKPLNNAIFQMLIDQLRKITSNESEQLDIINNSVMNGWNVFYSLDKNPNSLKVIKPTNDDDVQIEHEDVSDEELLELQRSLRGDD